MALSKKGQEELPFPIEDEQVNVEQVSFDDLDFEAEYDENDGVKEFLTISGKKAQYNPEYEQFKNYELDVGLDITGTPEVSIFPNDDKKYDALRLRVINDVDEEILDAYLNFPKADETGCITNINKSFDFYRTCFDFIYSVLRCRGDKYVLDKNGDEYNKFKRVNLMDFAKFVDQHSKVTVKITEGNESSDYDSWEIINME